jgi:FecR protein
MLLEMFLKLLNRVLVASLVMMVSFPSFAADKIGNVVAVVGSPSASGPSGNRSLKKDSEVFEDDTITVTTGNAQLILNDGTRIVVGPSSKLLLDQFVMGEKSKAKSVAIKGLRGTYRFITGKSDKSAYKIATAHGTIGIRGTAFDFWSREKTGAVVLRGRVSLKSVNGPKIDVNSGCQMGEATLGTAKLLTNKDKVATIKKNLPFLLDQSQLTPRFRLNVTSCRLNSTENQRDGNSNQPTFEREKGQQTFRNGND